jgi:hypothetical protein
MKECSADNREAGVDTKLQPDNVLDELNRDASKPKKKVKTWCIIGGAVVLLIAAFAIVFVPRIKLAKEASTLDASIVAACTDYTADEYDIIMDVYAQYESTTDDVRNRIANTDMLLEAVEQVGTLKAAAVVESISTQSTVDSSDLDDIYAEIVEYSPLMTREQKQTCLMYYAAFSSMFDVEETLKDKYILSPQSYHRYSITSDSLSRKELADREVYYCNVTITFSTSNLFGAEVMHDDLKMEATYNVNVDELSVELWTVRFCDAMDAYNAELKGRFL